MAGILCRIEGRGKSRPFFLFYGVEGVKNVKFNEFRDDYSFFSVSIK